MVKNLVKLQNELKAPKNQFNKFGGYKYRNCEDILEAVKPLCAKYDLQLVVKDTLVNLGYDRISDKENTKEYARIYVKAIAKICDSEGNEETGVGYAREPFDKKGMDSSQITGTASSYARKYALNGLFNIDDTKDADTNEHQEQTKKTTTTKKTTKENNDTMYATLDEKKKYQADCSSLKVDSIEILKQTGWKEGDKMTKEHLRRVYVILDEIKEESEKKNNE